MYDKCMRKVINHIPILTHFVENLKLITTIVTFYYNSDSFISLETYLLIQPSLATNRTFFYKKQKKKSAFLNYVTILLAAPSLQQ